jgi:hypothetical protein
MNILRMLYRILWDYPIRWRLRGRWKIREMTKDYWLGKKFKVEK